MKYRNTLSGEFIKRENRFVATCLVGGREEKVHVKNTGRMEELFVSGAEVVLSRSAGKNRKTAYDLVMVKKDGLYFNVDSQMPNRLFAEGFENGIIELEGCDMSCSLIAEKTYGSSRFDFMIKGNKSTFVEVKGVNLKAGNRALFPDGVSTRALKHVNELKMARLEGYGAFIVFIVQFEGADFFSVNEGHDYLKEALRDAKYAGVGIKAYSCAVESSGIEVKREIKAVL